MVQGDSKRIDGGSRAIGGYPSLELPLRHVHYHPKALSLNTARNALEYLLRARRYKKVYLPYYTCDAVLEPFDKLKIPYDFYQIDLSFEIADDICLTQREAILYTNYWGLKNEYSLKLADHYRDKLIIDNSQAFFASPIRDIPTFYSPRKFFGVADGGYLYTDAHIDMTLPVDNSSERMEYLLRRIDEGAEAGYTDFQKSEGRLIGQPIKEMSVLTSRILGSIDYEEAAESRRRNFNYLSSHLGTSNGISLSLIPEEVPLAYPYLTSTPDLRKRLISNRIYVPTYWPNVLNWVGQDSVEYKLVSELLPLPISHIYNLEDMEYIIKIIKGYE